MTDVYIGVAITVLILAILFYIDVKTKYGKYGPSKDKKISAWSLGDRKNHPLGAWLVSAFLWLILISVGFGTVQYMLYGHHGPHLAHKFGFGHHEEEGAKKSDLLGEVKHEGILEKNRHFHNLVEDTTRLDKNPVCYLCHGNFPHKRRRFIRVMMNMHTQFIGCFTCHVNPDYIPEDKITFEWENYSDHKDVGEPFGLKYDEKTGRIAETDNYYSKIIGFIEVRGKKEMLEIPQDAPIGVEYLKIQKELANDLQLQGQFKNRIHKNVMPKGRFCTRCHTAEEESYLPFRKLGFSDQRINDLTGLNIVGIVQKYKNFFIPSLYRGDQKESEEVIHTLVGKDASKKPVAPKGPVFDPKAWWRENYVKEQKSPQKVWKK